MTSEFFRPIIEELDGTNVKYTARLTPDTAVQLNAVGKRFGIHDGFELSSRAAYFVNWGAEGSREQGELLGLLPGSSEGIVFTSNILEAASRGEPDPKWLKTVERDILNQSGKMFPIKIWPETAESLEEAQVLTGIDSWEILLAHGAVLYKEWLETIMQGGLVMRRRGDGSFKDVLMYQESPMFKDGVPVRDFLSTIKNWGVVRLPDAA